MTTPPDDGGWLSPTHAWRVAQCPASAGPGVSGVVQIDGPPQNKGSLAHRVVDLWVRARGYEEADVRGAMRAAIDRAVAEVGSDLPSDWTLTGKRLLARAPVLAEAIGTDVSEVIPERTIRCATLHIYGTPDIVVIGNEITLIDLKTEQLDDDGLSPWITFQLSIYAYLVGQEHGRLPDRIEVFSTQRGRIPVPLTDRDIAVAIAGLEAARRADPSTANPSEETCRFCRRRLRCDAQWQAAPSWTRRDCVAGRVSRSERSTNGLTGLWLETADGAVLLSGVPTVLLSDIDGASIRAVRVRASQRADGEQPIWRWGTKSALARVSA
ncbi:MAG: PD-(D/E)XK nuclease family protein [Jatrophihabitans sp.]|uniref:PD-(D/E)XK nuclease family protein n=1 Tax=Jatrophihabitans sp. TaxID=1932789 RepID=UPI003F80E259